VRDTNIKKTSMIDGTFNVKLLLVTNYVANNNLIMQFYFT